MSFKYNRDDYHNRWYEDEELLPSGNTVKIIFYEDIDNLNSRRYYNIYFFTVHKLKVESSTIQFKSTGKDGLKGLIWARNKIKEFEEFIIDNKWFKGTFIISVSWDDNRRRKVYEYGLKPLGFKIEWLNSKKQLVKRIKIK
jgi:hypothetical protein